MDWTSMDFTGMGQEAMPPQQPMMSPMMNQTPPEVAAIAKPASTPEEIAQRKAGWQEVMNNPNFMRALAFMGTQLVQPIQAGQSRLGAFGQAFGTGVTALQAGEYASWEQKMKEQEAARKQAESSAEVALTQAKTPGAAAESAAAAGTVKPRIEQAGINLERAKIDLQNAKDEATIKPIETALKKRLLDIQTSIPDATVRAAEEAKINAAALAVEEARARIKLTTAHAAEFDAKAAKETFEAAKGEITYNVLKGMEPAEQKEFLTHTGRYAATTSGIAQQATMWGAIYDKLPADDPHKKGTTREQFQMKQLQSAKSKDASDILKSYITAMTTANLDVDPELVSQLAATIKQSSAPAGGSPAPAANLPAPKDKGEYDKLPKGTRYLAPNGKELVKQ